MVSSRLDLACLLSCAVLVACGTDDSATQSSTAGPTAGETQATTDETTSDDAATATTIEGTTTSDCGEIFGSNCFSDTDWSCTNVMCVAGEWECTCTQATTGNNSQTSSDTNTETDTDTATSG